MTGTDADVDADRPDVDDVDADRPDADPSRDDAEPPDEDAAATPQDDAEAEPRRDGDAEPSDERVRTLTRPDSAAAEGAITAALQRGDLVTVAGLCTVDYSGRASSTLGPGERHVMLKPDGTAMVHTVEGRQPVNWQPPGCEHAVDVVDGRLRIVSTRSTPEERLVVEFERLLQASAFDLADEEDLSLSGTHEDLKERVLDEPDRVEPGFTPLATERETPAGAVDVYGEDADGRTVVLELKRSRAGPDAVGQLERYVDALRRDLHDDAEVRGVLVAPSATDRARRLLGERGLEFVSLAPDPDEEA